MDDPLSQGFSSYPPNVTGGSRRLCLDVGGGLVQDMEEYALSNIPLRWMMREIVKAECHIRFDEAAVEEWNIPIATIEPMPIVRGVSGSTLRDDEPLLGQASSDTTYHDTSEREVNATTSMNTSRSTTWGKSARTPRPPLCALSLLDAEDAVQKMGNALRMNVFWWFVEIIPTYHEWQNEHNEWVGKWR
jgi:hypothetical protein